jgi:hypothetical protein
VSHWAATDPVIINAAVIAAISIRLACIAILLSSLCRMVRAGPPSAPIIAAAQGLSKTFGAGTGMFASWHDHVVYCEGATMTNQTFRVAILAIALALLASVPSPAQVGCAYDRPCITQLYISTSNQLVARINGSDWDVINIRWSRPGREGNQTEHVGKNAAFVVLKGVTPGVTYTVVVQGCNKRVLQSSRCSDWDRSTIKAY